MLSHSKNRRAGQDCEQDVLVIRDRENAQDHRESADIMTEADYYYCHHTAGATIGEAYNGATKDWSMIDVPPGTKRVTLDGVGGVR
ncbi:predicted protein [Coccidioides posadasii str. Silveira]|uniref:Predicted protein n=1 Tax=Coccidioides posadasii (strain RMSCC 757 / Silveira) TaxID=443226 RepID=E9DBS9_COCPS|nr:predicted protein [Coccidioides posadasii str. Silveira]